MTVICVMAYFLNSDKISFFNFNNNKRYFQTKSDEPTIMRLPFVV